MFLDFLIIVLVSMIVGLLMIKHLISPKMRIAAITGVIAGILAYVIAYWEESSKRKDNLPLPDREPGTPDVTIDPSGDSDR